MLDDVEQSDNPTVTEPMVLDGEALKAYEPPSTLLDRMTKATQEGPKRRGRPPGSKNKATVARERQVGVAKGTPSRMITPTRKKPDEKKDDGLSAAERREYKEARAEELSTKVTDSLNENIALMLTSMGVPTQFIYKPGQEPKAVAENSKYTDLAGMVMINPFQANLIGKFLAEAEGTSVGTKFADATGGSNVGLVVYGILSLGAVGQYVKGLTQFYSNLKPLMEAYQAELAKTTGGNENAG